MSRAVELDQALSYTPHAVGVCVLGMSRSGTSAIAGMFRCAGFFAGADDDIYPADQSNPAGHHENLTIVQTNERLLWGLGGTLFSPPPEGIDAATQLRGGQEVEAKVDRLLRHAGTAPLVVKDPRIAFLLPLWSGVMPGLLHPVLVVRHPVEVARSLYHRDGMPMPVAFAAWEVHLTALLSHLHEQVITVAPYPALPEDDRLAVHAVREISATLEATRAQDVDPALANVGFRPDLYRNHSAPVDAARHLTECQRLLWNFLSAVPAGLQRLHVPAEFHSPSSAALATVRAEGSRVVLENELRVELQRRHDRNVELEVELEKVRARKVELEAELEQVRTRNDQLERRRLHSPLVALDWPISQRVRGR